MIVTTNFFDESVLLDLTDTVTNGNYAGILNTVACGLFTNTPSLTPATLLSDLTELPTSSWAAYARVSPVVWIPPVNEDDFTSTLVSDIIEFRCSVAPTTPVTVTGYFLAANSSGTPLLMAELFPETQQLVFANDAIIFSVVLNYGVQSANSTCLLLT